MPKPRKKFQHLSFAMGMFTFSISAMEAFNSGLIALTMVSLVAVFLNLLAILRRHHPTPGLDIAIDLFNAAAAFLTALALFEAGKKGLPYVWLMATAVFCLSSFLRHRKWRKEKGNLDSFSGS
ncbi:MAG TPA: hypothetical protein PKV71_08795 [Calditrichia bacterium]|nr:hypothetical protein [Calditrichia bacterium]HQV31960.1 hypothetical protein [Calditrichia bacterium]